MTSLAGVASLADIDELTVFADNLVPQMRRTDGVLVYDPELASRIDAGIELSAGRAMEHELRACTVHACERLAADSAFPRASSITASWNRGQARPHSKRPAHRRHSVFY